MQEIETTIKTGTSGPPHPPSVRCLFEPISNTLTLILDKPD